jgi:hypothetical protein
LQQLVSAQASRNRELEQQLQSMHITGEQPGGGPKNGDGNEDEMLMLHDEVSDDFNLNLGMSSPPRMHRRQTSTSSRTKKFGGFELESVAEMEQDTDNDAYEYGSYHLRHGMDEDHDMDRPSTAGTGVGASPLSVESASDENEGDADDTSVRQHEEEERGRKGRDGRPMGHSGLNGVVLKTEEGMETS